RAAPAAPRRDIDPRRHAGDANLVVVEVTARILGPGVAGQLPGPRAAVAAADVAVYASAAATLERPRTRLQAFHERLGGLLPDVGERPLAHGAEAVVPPHGIRVHVAEVVDVGDVHSRGITAPAPQHGLEPPRLVGHVAAHPVQKEHTVGIVVAGDELAVAADGDVVEGGGDQGPHRLASHRQVGVVLAV